MRIAAHWVFVLLHFSAVSHVSLANMVTNSFIPFGFVPFVFRVVCHDWCKKHRHPSHTIVGMHNCYYTIRLYFILYVKVVQ